MTGQERTMDERLERMKSTWETPCPSREDKQHCEHWYDGQPCCDCGDEAMMCRCGHPFRDHRHPDAPQGYKLHCGWVMEGECRCRMFEVSDA